jgi:mediator of RNA polymerase II transcription subunit 31
MDSGPMSVDSAALDPPAIPSGADEPKHGGYSRFELELEVCLSALAVPPLPAS